MENLVSSSEGPWNAKYCEVAGRATTAFTSRSGKKKGKKESSDESYTMDSFDDV
jgi:hypothetical protein